MATMLLGAGASTSPASTGQRHDAAGDGGVFVEIDHRADAMVAIGDDKRQAAAYSGSTAIRHQTAPPAPPRDWRRGKVIRSWFADEARIGQKNQITRRWAKRGTRPSAPHDQRTASTYIFGAVCPKRGKGAALILPACNTEAMNLHLAEIAAAIAPAAHAILLVDQAGWHMSTRLVVPANITIIALPPKCPELNPVENVWQFMRDNWLSNRIFKLYDDLVDHCCEAWNKLVDQPWRIMSIGLRQWAHEF